MYLVGLNFLFSDLLWSTADCKKQLEDAIEERKFDIPHTIEAKMSKQNGATLERWRPGPEHCQTILVETFLPALQFKVKGIQAPARQCTHTCMMLYIHIYSDVLFFILLEHCISIVTFVG